MKLSASSAGMKRERSNARCAKLVFGKNDVALHTASTSQDRDVGIIDGSPSVG
jgi:hypothetical protein